MNKVHGGPMKTEYKQDRFLGKTQTHHNDDKDITVINNSRNTTENTVKKSLQNINANKNGINKFLFSVFIAICFLSGSLSLAQDHNKENKDKAEKLANDKNDKLDLKKLEDKYWSAKDTDFNVVQNRTYAKTKKTFVSLSYGPLVNDAYSYGRMTNLSGGYYFSERLGLEIAYEQASIKNNESTDTFIKQNQFAPDYNIMKNYTSLNVVLVPFYAKMSFWDRKILYFDMQFAFGVGQMKYQIQKVNGNPVTNTGVEADEDKTALGYNFDVTQQLFFHENFAVRFDIKNKWSKQTKERYFIQSGQSRDLGDTTQQDTTMLLGMTFFY
jgi:outer membrane beta-barrel protein